MSGPIAGEDSDSRISLRINDLLLDQFDGEVEDSAEYANRSDAIRALMRDFVDDDTGGLPRQPPTEPQLEHGYRRLCMAANSNGIIPGDTARRVTSGGPNQLAKTETGDLVLKPLQRRGYIARKANLYGDESYRIHGLEAHRSQPAVATDGGEADE